MSQMGAWTCNASSHHRLACSRLSQNSAHFGRAKPRHHLCARNAAVSSEALTARKEVGGKDLTAVLLEKVVNLALRSRLKSHAVVDTQVWADTLGIMGGRFRAMQIHGERWLTPLGMSAEVLEVAVGELLLDYGALVWQRQVALTNIPTGRCKIVLRAADLGAFTVHPVLTEVAATAIQGEPFLFDKNGVVITDQEVEIRGSWRGETYICVMKPLSGDHECRQLQMAARHISGEPRKETEVVAVEMGKFFAGLEINLQGVELAGPCLTLIPATGLSPSLLEIEMDLCIRKFPPLNLSF